MCGSPVRYTECVTCGCSDYIYKAISTRPVLSGLTVFTTSHQLSWSCLCIQQFKREFVCLHLSSKSPICLGNFISFLMTQSESFNSYTAITSPLLSWCFSPVFVKLAYSEKIQILGAFKQITGAGDRITQQGLTRCPLYVPRGWSCPSGMIRAVCITGTILRHKLKLNVIILNWLLRFRLKVCKVIN